MVNNIHIKVIFTGPGCHVMNNEVTGSYVEAMVVVVHDTYTGSNSVLRRSVKYIGHT